MPRLRRVALGQCGAVLIMLETADEDFGLQYALQRFQVAFAVMGPAQLDARQCIDQ